MSRVKSATRTKSAKISTKTNKMWFNDSKEIYKNEIKVNDNVSFKDRSYFKKEFKKDSYSVGKVVSNNVYIKVGKKLIAFDYKEFK
jgi:hypothetical protein